MRHGGGHLTAPAEFFQMAVDLFRWALLQGDPQVRGGEVVFQVQALAAAQGFARAQADKAFLEQALHAQPFRQHREDPEGAIQLATRHLLGHAPARSLADVQVNARRLATQDPQQPRQHYPGAVVGHAQA